MYLRRDFNKVKIIPVDDNQFNTVVALIPKEWGLDIKNNFQAFTGAGDANWQKMLETVKPDSGYSLVPNAPMMWVSSEPLSFTSLDLYFVSEGDALKDVHNPLMMLLAISMPRPGNEVGAYGVSVQMLRPPAQVHVQIADGRVLNWKNAFISQCTIHEFSPYDSRGYGTLGKATVQLINKYHVTSSDIIQQLGGKILLPPKKINIKF